VETEDDPAIVRRVLGGDAHAFRVLVERHQGRVLGFLGALLPGAPDREDVAQEAFVAAWRRLATFDPARGTFLAWLLRIARNGALNSLRRRRPSGGVAAPEPSSPVDAREVDPDPARRLDRALLRLPPEQRSALLLAEVYGLSLAEVAEVEDVPLGTVKSRIGRALERLRASLACPAEPPS
jgi:RNA polymerase sigma-70 factor (ECF subfamily)